jgi:thiamine-monophosphate kinase
MEPKPPHPSNLLDERAWLESLRKQTSAPGRPTKTSRGLQLGIGDDCAILQPPDGHQILITTDFSLENVHFRRDWHPPESVGHRCLARGLSDIAAMGGQPMAAFLSLAIPAELAQSRRGKSSWRERFFAGFLALADNFHVPLAGGDTARSPQLNPPGTSSGLALADIVLVGSAPRNRALLRSGARPGDKIYVTGHLGGAAAELSQLSAHPRRFRNCTQSSPAHPNPHPHLFPQPRLAIGAWLLKNHRATAAIDISDGLSTDLDHICEESGVSAIVDASALPLYPSTLDQASLHRALNGGEDYELLFTASPKLNIPRRIAAVQVTCIGEIFRQAPRAPRMLLRQQDKEYPILPGGWGY